ncbi:MAG: DUF72 domain-containing protein, partial [Promethearchaeota archaeon]
MANEESKVVVGTSGWSYAEWKGPFYPPKLPDAQMLDFYTRVFRTCEINTTFYHNPRLETARRWAEQTPRYFDFSVKLPRKISHEVKLDPGSVQALLGEFLKVVYPLWEAEKISSFLLQLPPKFSKDKFLGDLEHFLELWATIEPFPGSDPLPLAVEFRNKSWLEDRDVFSLLGRFNASYVIVVEPLLPPV